MSRRKRQRRLEERYGNLLAPWIVGVLAACALLMLAIYIGAMPL
jgi:hypothetical protein